MKSQSIISADFRVERATPTPATDQMEAAKKMIVSEGARLCADATGLKARAIVLTGSMSRGEATLKRDGEQWRVLGDATFLVVFDEAMQLAIAELEAQIQRCLLQQGINCKVVVVTSTTGELRKMRPHIYAYELRERGVVLWGDKRILRQMPQFGAADIPKEDGWWFLCNRMIEQLEAAANAGSMDDNAVRYRIAKLYLAMAACYLLVIGQYEPSYRERVARLQELATAHESPSAPVPLIRFSRLVSQCTDLKLHGEMTCAPGDFPQWRDAVEDAEAIWRWSLSCILGRGAYVKSEDLLAAMAARQSMFARAKGWARAAVVQKSAFPRYWLRWARLACSMSPRYLVYGAASKLFFSARHDGIASRELEPIVADLPLPAKESAQDLSWRSAAKLVAHNFHVLLESTRS